MRFLVLELADRIGCEYLFSGNTNLLMDPSHGSVSLCLASKKTGSWKNLKDRHTSSRCTNRIGYVNMGQVHAVSWFCQHSLIPSLFKPRFLQRFLSHSFSSVLFPVFPANGVVTGIVSHNSD